MTAKNKRSAHKFMAFMQDGILNIYSIISGCEYGNKNHFSKYKMKKKTSFFGRLKSGFQQTQDSIAYSQLTVGGQNEDCVCTTIIKLIPTMNNYNNS